MKAIRRVQTATEAHKCKTELQLAGIFSSISGCQKLGYEVLVMDTAAPKARELLDRLSSPTPRHDRDTDKPDPHDSE